MRVLPSFAAALAFVVAPLVARADEPEPTPIYDDLPKPTVAPEPQHRDTDVPPAPRVRRDAALFGIGLTSAIVGGVTLNAGFMVLSVGALENTAHRGSGREAVDVGGALLGVGVAAILVGIPLAIYGGKKIPAGEFAFGPGAVRVTF